MTLIFLIRCGWFVEEAVELLNENESTEETHIETVETIETTEGSSEEEQIEVAVIEEDQNEETQLFSVQTGSYGFQFLEN